MNQIIAEVLYIVTGALFVVAAAVIVIQKIRDK